MPKVLSLITLRTALQDEIAGRHDYMRWYRETGNKKFLRMANDEKRHARILMRIISGRRQI